MAQRLKNRHGHSSQREEMDENTARKDSFTTMAQGFVHDHGARFRSRAWRERVCVHARAMCARQDKTGMQDQS